MPLSGEENCPFLPKILFLALPTSPPHRGVPFRHKSPNFLCVCSKEKDPPKGFTTGKGWDPPASLCPPLRCSQFTQFGASWHSSSWERGQEGGQRSTGASGSNLSSCRQTSGSSSLRFLGQLHVRLNSKEACTVPLGARKERTRRPTAVLGVVVGPGGLGTGAPLQPQPQRSPQTPPRHAAPAPARGLPRR